MEIKTMTCPNCGANTTNAQNCEYCGSLLVRFVDRGIDLSKTSYTNDSATFPGLAAELKRNLMLQEKNPTESVVTDLCAKIEGSSSGCSILKSGFCSWHDGKLINISESKNGLMIIMFFETFIDSNYYKEHNQRMEKQLKTFKKLDSFPLFTGHICNYTDDDGNELYSREYAIDFGNDAEGAARFISEILQKVEGWTMETNFDMYTEVGDEINKARVNWDKAHGFGVEEESSFWLNAIWGGIVGLVVWFLFKIIF